MTNSIHVERRGKVLEITLDRPKANAIDMTTSQELTQAFLSFRDDPELRAAVVTGAGERFFSAGWDLNAAAEGEAVDADHGPGGFAGLTEMFDLDKPVIAAVNGLAVGGGFELALACDLIVASEHAEFFLPEINLGMIASSGGVLRLPRRIPRQIAVEMLLSGRRMSAPEAARWGLVNECVPSSEVMPAARALSSRIAEAAPLAVAAVKEVLRVTELMSLEKAFALMRSDPPASYRRMLESEDVREGPKAFAEGRDPVWKAR